MIQNENGDKHELILGSMLQRPYTPASDLDDFKRQQSVFTVLNLCVLGLLGLFHTLFASLLGNPSGALLVVLGAAFLARTLQLIWIQSRSCTPSQKAVSGLTLLSIAANLACAIFFAALTNRQDSPYWVLTVMPVVESAFRFSLSRTLAVTLIGSGLNIYWVWHFSRVHPPVGSGEFFEAATISLIYFLIGVLVSLLVSQLRKNQQSLARNLDELERTRERLVQEEKLGAVGRFASAIAHEIRNPVAMISSSLATATNSTTEQADREEMFSIAAKEANRLEQLTTDFLQYARPLQPNRSEYSIAEVVSYVLDVCRARARDKRVVLTEIARVNTIVCIDAGLIQQALLNLVMNAIDAAPECSEIVVRATAGPDASTSIDVENRGNAIPHSVANKIFEPFFTTKPRGTGLGLAITRNIARSHGGDLQLTSNETGRICFTLTIGVTKSEPVEEGRG
jgi:signal transduction histidine kinase